MSWLVMIRFGNLRKIACLLQAILRARLAPGVRRRAGAMALLALAACSMFGGPPSLKIGEVRVRTTLDANRNSPVVLAVVLVADQELEKRLLDPAQKWFEQEADLTALYPQALQAYRCELTPGQEWLLPPTLFRNRHVYAVLVLADIGGVEKRARIDGWQAGGLLDFGRENWRVIPDSKAPAATARPPEMSCRQSGAAP